MWTPKTPPCVRSTRPHVYRHHAHMLFNMCACCRHTRGRFECTHGGVLSLHTGFSACHTPLHNHHTPHTTTHHDHQQHSTTTHNDTHIARRQRQRKKTEKEDREREEKTKEKMKNKMKERKTEIMMWTYAECKFAQEKAKLAN